MQGASNLDMNQQVALFSADITEEFTSSVYNNGDSRYELLQSVFCSDYRFTVKAIDKFFVHV